MRTFVAVLLSTLTFLLLIVVITFGFGFIQSMVSGLIHHPETPSWVVSVSFIIIQICVQSASIAAIGGIVDVFCIENQKRAFYISFVLASVLTILMNISDAMEGNVLTFCIPVAGVLLGLLIVREVYMGKWE